jgi:hypothetical protein
MRVAYVAFALLASLSLSVGVASSPVSAGCYNDCDGGPPVGGPPPMGAPVYKHRTSETYYGERPYYGEQSGYRERSYEDRGPAYHTTYYERPSYDDGYSYRTSYRSYDDGYYGRPYRSYGGYGYGHGYGYGYGYRRPTVYSGGGWEQMAARGGCGRRTLYIPYGYSWSKSHDYKC